MFTFPQLRRGIEVSQQRTIRPKPITNQMRYMFRKPFAPAPAVELSDPD
jgi:hypothetical protein